MNLNMVFNPPMSIETDRTLIDDLGGPAKVAVLLGLPGAGTQRVHNWMRRGIPPAVKVEFPHYFMPNMVVALVNPTQHATEFVAQGAAHV